MRCMIKFRNNNLSLKEWIKKFEEKKIGQRYDCCTKKGKNFI